MIQDKDYIMRLVHEIARMLIRMIFNRDIDREGELPVAEELLERYQTYMAMIDDGQINEAENRLLDEMDLRAPAYFEMALRFYEKLGSKSEEFLEEHDYTQDEVLDGIKYVVDCYGYGDLWDPVSR